MDYKYIQELRQTHSVKAIAEIMFRSTDTIRGYLHVTGECEKHSKLLYDKEKCLMCLTEKKYTPAYIKRQGIENECKRLSYQDRHDYVVLQRKILVKFLREKGYSYPKIGKMLKRDHSTIMNLAE